MPEKRPGPRKIYVERHPESHPENPGGLKSIVIETDSARTTNNVRPEDPESVHFDNLRMEHGEFKKVGKQLAEAIERTDGTFLSALNPRGQLERIDMVAAPSNHPIMRAHTYHDMLAIKDQLMARFEKRLAEEPKPEPVPHEEDLLGIDKQMAGLSFDEAIRQLQMKRYSNFLDKLIKFRSDELR